MVALYYFFEVFEINSPSDKDIKNNVLILYHLTFHNDLSNIGFFLKKSSFNFIFLVTAGFQEIS